MTNFVIDNSDNRDIERAITWQFDKSTNLASTILMLKDFFKNAVTDFWDLFARSLNISDADDCSDFGLAVWGKILGVPRFEINGNAMSKELYRKILVARARLLYSNASFPKYIEFFKYIFGNNVIVSDIGNMALSFSLKTNPTLTQEERYVFNNLVNSIVVYPAGVKSSAHSTSKMFGLSTNNSTPQDSSAGGLDNSSFNWKASSPT